VDALRVRLDPSAELLSNVSSAAVLARSTEMSRVEQKRFMTGH
jgi:hypothetical protein